jgi:hypothetical protein
MIILIERESNRCVTFISLCVFFVIVVVGESFLEKSSAHRSQLSVLLPELMRPGNPHDSHYKQFS